MPEEKDIFSAFGAEEKREELALMQKALDMVPDTPGMETPLVTKTREYQKQQTPYTARQFAMAHTEDALKVIADIMNDEDAEDSTRLEAAKVMLDRGWGKATVHNVNTKITLRDVEAKLLADKARNDDKWLEAQRSEETDGLARYIVADAECVKDVTGHSQGLLHDSQERGGDSTARLQRDSDADHILDLEAVGTKTDGSLSDSEAKTDLCHYGN